MDAHPPAAVEEDDAWPAGRGSGDPSASMLFLAGLHRSGTSLLAELVARHPEISGLTGTGFPEDEGQFVQTVYPLARQFGGPGKFGFDPRAHQVELPPEAAKAAAERLETEWARYWESPAPVRLEKSPPNLLRLRFLYSVFPEAAFVVLIRHPLEVGMATQKWGRRRRLYTLVRHWFHCHAIFERDREYVPRLLLVRYEDLIDDPSAVVGSIHRFVGLGPHCDVEGVSAGHSEKYWVRWREMDRSLRGRVDRTLITRRFEAPATRYGYSFRGPR